jgi:hypothetical protein
MNIREHIEAGHYPTDDRGRALVPTRCGNTFVAAATDRPHEHPIVGWSLVGGEGMSFTEHGTTRNHSESVWLLPPPPRKVKVTTWGLFWPEGTEYSGVCYGVRKTRIEAERRSLMPTGGNSVELKVVELTGEYEEPWL